MFTFAIFNQTVRQNTSYKILLQIQDSVRTLQNSNILEWRFMIYLQNQTASYKSSTRCHNSKTESAAPKQCYKICLAQIDIFPSKTPSIKFKANNTLVITLDCPVDMCLRRKQVWWITQQLVEELPLSDTLFLKQYLIAHLHHLPHYKSQIKFLIQT